MISVNIVNKSDNEMPKYATKGSSGMDLRADLETEEGKYESVVINPLERKLIPTGIYIALPEGYEANVRPRSGLALKHGITVLNTPGLIDSDYRGEIKVILVNLSNEPFTVNHGDRIAQISFSKAEIADLVKVDVLDATERAEGGFGHTGNK